MVGINFDEPPTNFTKPKIKISLGRKSVLRDIFVMKQNFNILKRFAKQCLFCIFCAKNILMSCFDLIVIVNSGQTIRYKL